MCVSFRWLRVPTLPSLTWQKLCPASSLSNLYWWMVKLPTHTPTYSHAYTVCGKRYTVTFSPPYLAFSRNLLLFLFRYIFFFLSTYQPVILFHMQEKRNCEIYFSNYSVLHCTHAGLNILMEQRSCANLILEAVSIFYSETSYSNQCFSQISPSFSFFLSIYNLFVIHHLSNCPV